MCNGQECVDHSIDKEFDAVEMTLVDQTSMHLANHHYLNRARYGDLRHANQALIVDFPACQHLNLSLCPQLVTKSKISRIALSCKREIQLPASTPEHVPTYLHSIFPLREMCRLLLLLLRHDRCLMLAQPPPDRSGLLWA